MSRNRTRDRNRAWAMRGGAAPFVGPLDAYTSNLSVAYSATRRLLTSYTGPLIRLRRASDDAELDIGYDSNGALDTAAAAAFIGGSSGFVVTLPDQGGGGHDLTQGTAASQPAYQATGFQSKPTLSFDGSNDYLRCASGVAFGAFSIYVAGKWNMNTAALLYEHSNDVNSNDGCFMNAGAAGSAISAKRASNNVRNDNVGRMADNTSRIICHRYNGTEATHLLWSNGADRSLSANITAPGTATVTTSFNLHARNGGVAPLLGVTSELIGYKTYHDATTRDAVGGIINTQFAVY